MHLDTAIIVSTALYAKITSHYGSRAAKKNVKSPREKDRITK